MNSKGIFTQLGVIKNILNTLCVKVSHNSYRSHFANKNIAQCHAQTFSSLSGTTALDKHILLTCDVNLGSPLFPEATRFLSGLTAVPPDSPPLPTLRHQAFAGKFSAVCALNRPYQEQTILKGVSRRETTRKDTFLGFIN